MNITGHLLLGSREAWGRQAAFHALNPATGEPLAPAFSGAGEAEVREACAMADVVMDEFHYYSDRDRGVAWQVPLLILKRARFLLMSATLGDTAFFEEKLTELTGRPTARERREG